MDATFQDQALFQDCHFEKFANFYRASFERNAIFKGARFGERVDFDSRFTPGAPVYFDFPSKKKNIVPFKKPEEGESAYRLAKSAARARGNSLAEGEFHFAEQCALEYKLRPVPLMLNTRADQFSKELWGWIRWITRVVIGRWLFGYGERPLNALKASGLVIALFSLFSWFCGGIQHAKEVKRLSSFLDHLYFSFVTFTTLGYGDFRPVPGLRLLFGFEAFLGAALMATFIVGLTRKYMR